MAQQHMLLGLAKDLYHHSVGLLAILHDLNLAVQYADEILFLQNGHTVAYGPVEEVVTREVIEKTFAYPVRLVHDSGQMIIVPENPLYHSKSIHA